MNKIFKVIWNKTTQRLEVVSELAKGAVKSSSNSVVNLAKDLSKPVLKLSLLSICLGYPTWVMAATGAENGAVKYGDYGIAIGGYGGGAQVGPKPKEGNRVAAVGNRQISIGHDKLVASGNNSIVIGSDYGHANAWGLTYRQGGTQGFNTVGIGAGAQSIGLNALALGAASGSGVGYQGYDDAVYLGSFSRIAPKGLGQNYTDAEINNLNNTYVTAVEAFNQNQNENTLNAVKEAGRKINNAALNKVEGMTIKSNVVHLTQTGKFTTQDQQVSQINGSAGNTTVSILSVGGKDGNNTMYRQIQNVAAGRIASDSNDAVNGSQLYYVRNYTGWNIGHYDDVTRANTTTGRVNNDHTVIFKPGNYTDVRTSLDSTNRSTVNIEVKTANLGTEVANGKISKITVTDPISTDANNTVARTAGVKSVLDKFNEIKADKVDIMGYSHVNETDANNVTANRIITAKQWENQFNNNNGTYRESAGAQGNRAITSGVRANALANDSIAIGSLANVNNNWGNQVVAAERSIAIGREATVNAGKDSIAMGSGAQILHSDATTLNANNAIAIGKLSKVDQASNAIALGNNASIGGNYASNGVWKASDNSIAIGNSTTVSRENSVGIGTNVSVARENSVVIGQEAKATRERVVAIGAYATANGDRTVVIGPEAIANGSKSIVIGGIGDANAKAIAEKDQAIVIGNGAQATDNAAYSVTLGNNAKTAGATGISIGDRAQVVASAANGIALGQSAVANNSGDIAIGHSSSTSTKHTVSDIKIGDKTLSKGVTATDNGTVSFGNNTIRRQIQNVGAGEISATSSDVITGSQLYYVIQAADEIAKTEYKFKVNGVEKKIMRNNSTSATNSANNTLDFKAGDGLEVAYENDAVTYKLNDDSKQAITDAKTAAQTVTTKLNQIDQSVQRAETAATNAASSATVASTAAKVAISSASAANSSATAASTSASTANSSATAASTSASAANSSATAASTSASAANSSATAASTSASAANSSATAASTSASAANSSATAASSSASAANSSATAASSSASAANSSATAASSSATAASSSASAANSSATAASSAASAAQSSAQRIEDSGLISKDGKTAFAADNTSNRDSAKAKGKDATAAGYGSNASGKNATAIGNNATASGRNSTALGQNATATAENSVAIGQDSVANERNTVSVGRVGNERRITNVADPVNNTDAANKRYVDNAVGSVRNDLRKTEKKLRGGVAGATAMANIPQVTQPGKLMVGAGIGNYKGQSAVAVGLSKSSDNNRVIFKMSGSATTQGDYNIGAGIGYQW